MFVYVSVWAHMCCGLCVGSPRAWRKQVLSTLSGRQSCWQVLRCLCCPFNNSSDKSLGDTTPGPPRISVEICSQGGGWKFRWAVTSNRALDSVNLRESPQVRPEDHIPGSSRSPEADSRERLSGAKQVSCSSWVTYAMSQEERAFAAGLCSIGGELQWVSYTVSAGFYSVREGKIF